MLDRDGLLVPSPLRVNVGLWALPEILPHIAGFPTIGQLIGSSGTPQQRHRAT